MKIKRILTLLLLIILSVSAIAFGANIPLGPYFDDTYFDLSDSALILKIVPHEKGGLEVDVSAYDGLIKITGGTTSNLTIGIADDNIVEMDDADAAADDYCKLTANGIVGRSYSEVRIDLGIDLTLYYLKTEMDSFSELQGIISDKTLINEEDAITLDNDLNMGTHKITGVVDPVNPQEAATKAYADTKASTYLELTDTPSSYTGKSGEILRVNSTPDAVEFSGIGIETTLTVDSDAKVPTSKAVNDFCETTKDYKGKNYYSALGEDNTYSDNADTDTQLVGEAVVFGNLLYFNWTDKEWKLTDADAAATMPGLRIALESKTDGQTCLMLVKGYIRADSPFQFAAPMIYASTITGCVSHIAPTESGDQIQRVGVAKSADILFFDPSIDVGEI